MFTDGFISGIVLFQLWILSYWIYKNLLNKSETFLKNIYEVLFARKTRGSIAQIQLPFCFLPILFREE